MNADLALQRLIEGNKRFAESKSIYPNQDIKRRQELTGKQQPYALILGCYDSRLTPEIIFDQGLGDLFIIRTAGNVLNYHILGSIEYAVKYVNIPLIVVLGHEDCVAIDLALKHIATSSHIDSVLESIRLNIGKIDTNEKDFLNTAIKTNVDTVVNQLKSSAPILSRLVKEDKLEIAGAYYNLKSGIVDIL